MQEKKLEKNLIKIPDISEIKGDITRELNPLGMLYLILFGNLFFSPHVSFDATKIRLSTSDSKRLYYMLREYIEVHYKVEKPGDIAVGLWNELGPWTSDRIPDGYVELAEGYIMLKANKI